MMQIWRCIDYLVIASISCQSKEDTSSKPTHSQPGPNWVVDALIYTSKLTEALSQLY
jgi:hypothetical protein